MQVSFGSSCEEVPTKSSVSKFYTQIKFVNNNNDNDNNFIYIASFKIKFTKCFKKGISGVLV